MIEKLKVFSRTGQQCLTATAEVDYKSFWFPDIQNPFKIQF